MKSISRIIFITVLLAITSCSSPKLRDYQQTTPVLNLKTFFNGELVAYGMVLGRQGELTRRFSVVLRASWQENKGVIDEQFTFDDGEKMTRVWTLVETSPNNYQGTASDVIGIAKGKTTGSILYWQYDMTINVDGSDYQVTLDDWMYLLDENRLFNKTDIVKFGIKVGEIVLYIEKQKGQ